MVYVKIKTVNIELNISSDEHNIETEDFLESIKSAIDMVVEAESDISYNNQTQTDWDEEDEFLSNQPFSTIGYKHMAQLPKQEEDEIINISDHDGIGNAVDNLNNTPPQETTLEEAAEKYAKQFDWAEDSSPQIDFMEGAKWQEERMYIEEEVFELIRKAFEAGYKKYEVVEAGLEGLETDVECNWILKKYGKNNLL